VIRAGYHAELDELRGAARDGKTWIARFQAQRDHAHRINSLKVGLHQVFGYYIEIKNANTTRGVRYVRKQTLRRRALRHPDLKEYEEKILGARSAAAVGVRAVRGPCATGSRRKRPRLLGTAEVMATLDVLAALAELASTRRTPGRTTRRRAGAARRRRRHPSWIRRSAGDAVPNETSTCRRRGPALGSSPGRTCRARECSSARWRSSRCSRTSAASCRPARPGGLADRVFTRVGAGRRAEPRQSTFMVEMTRRRTS